MMDTKPNLKRQSGLMQFFGPKRSKIEQITETTTEIISIKENGTESMIQNHQSSKTSKTITNIDTIKFTVSHDTLLTGVYKAPVSSDVPIPVAAFDLDSTLTFTKTGSPYPANGEDWKWASMEMVKQLKQLNTGNHSNHPRRHALVIISNQGGFMVKETYKRYAYFKQRITAICKDLNIPIRIYAATKPARKDVINKFRKPERGMWDAMIEDLRRNYDLTVDKGASFYVGDAAGRPGDFADSDLKFAKNVGIKFYTPEEFLTNRATNDERTTSTSRSDDQEKNSKK